MSERPSTELLEQAIGVSYDPDLLRRALTHRSYAYENGGLPTNERLEFLGDAVLGLIVTSALYRSYPDLPEGQLAKLRASVVNMRALAEVARTLGTGGLGAHLLLGKGEEATGGRDKASILADTLEALLGAIYLQHGLQTASDIVHRLFDPLMAEAAQRGAGLDWKTSLQELTATNSFGVPEYRVAESGPDHAKTFAATAVVAGEELGVGEGRSKKEAEQRAAELAWRALRARLDGVVVPTAQAVAVAAVTDDLSDDSSDENSDENSADDSDDVQAPVEPARAASALAEAAAANPGVRAGAAGSAVGADRTARVSGDEPPGNDARPRGGPAPNGR